jgi:hypothetical protein
MRRTWTKAKRSGSIFIHTLQPYANENHKLMFTAMQICLLTDKSNRSATVIINMHLLWVPCQIFLHILLDFIIIFHDVNNIGIHALSKTTFRLKNLWLQPIAPPLLKLLTDTPSSQLCVTFSLIPILHFTLMSSLSSHFLPTILEI